MISTRSLQAIINRLQPGLRSQAEIITDQTVFERTSGYRALKLNNLVKI